MELQHKTIETFIFVHDQDIIIDLLTLKILNMYL